MATLMVAACATSPGVVQTPLPDTVDALAAAIAADAKRSDDQMDSKTRDDVAADALRNADACIARAPQAVACLYGRGVALGLDAQAHPIRAEGALRSMIESLASAEAVDPNYDHGGPARVRALVLLRAPGWPLGPGDTDQGLAAARRAVTAQPQYPPNQLALGEALARTGDANGARAAYAQAGEEARALPPGADRDKWLREAEEAVQHGK
jgi:hypothetical protein